MRRSAVVVAVSLLAVAGGCQPTTVTGAGGGDATGISVVSQDLGFGADLEAVLAAAPADRPARVDAMWAEQERASFAVRVGAIADAIARANPDLVGVQSALLWRRAIPAGAAPATDVASDYLALLVAALAARGAAYDAVATVETADLQLTGASGNDYRVTDREAILARVGVVTSAPASGTFLARRTVPLGAVAFEHRRGWVSVQATRGERSFRFASTHLDGVDPAVQAAQARELLSAIAGGGPTIVTGGIPSDSRDPSWPAYGILVSSRSGFMDLAREAGGALTTCCRDARLVDPAAQLDRRLDLVLGTYDFAPYAGGRILADSLMVDGIWPSSHAGVMALFRLP